MTEIEKSITNSEEDIILDDGIWYEPFDESEEEQKLECNENCSFCTSINSDSISNEKQIWEEKSTKYKINSAELNKIKDTFSTIDLYKKDLEISDLKIKIKQWEKNYNLLLKQNLDLKNLEIDRELFSLISAKKEIEECKKKEDAEIEKINKDIADRFNISVKEFKSGAINFVEERWVSKEEIQNGG